MKLLSITLLPLFFFISCSSTPDTTGTESPQNPLFPVALSHQFTGNKLTVQATVTNQSPNPITLVENPNFFSFSLAPTKAGSSRVVNKKIVTYAPVVSKEVVNLAPGKAKTFTSHFLVREAGEGRFELERSFQPFPPRSYTIFTDPGLKLSFSYEHYPRFLNETSKKKAAQFLTTPLRATKTFKKMTTTSAAITNPTANPVAPSVSAPPAPRILQPGTTYRPPAIPAAVAGPDYTLPNAQ